MELHLNGKNAFVAGSSAGMGRAIATALAEEGCNVVLCARCEERLREACEEIRRKTSADISFVTADLDERDDIDRAIRLTLERYGGIDILVTNNGGPPPGCFDDLDETQWELGWQRTLMSMVRLTRGFLPSMRRRQYGRVINITSISVRQPIQRLLLSNAYRAAVTATAKTLADEYAADGITVNNIAPGYISTQRLSQLFSDTAHTHNRSVDEEIRDLIERIPARRLGTPEDVAALACFLASDRASYITGTTILVDGGLYRGL
ncbi:MAG: SDR family oxidoreductase [Bacteroidota bacterium]|nr:SDR family oxidoreductase [Bacteroidota bacterium]